MPRKVSLSARDYVPGAYQVEIDAPNRKNSAVITMTREGLGWPVGELFTYRVYERNRGSQTLQLLTGATESGGPAVGRDGTVNPPLRISLQWAPDKDKDVIRFEMDVVQTFRTAITMEFL